MKASIDLIILSLCLAACNSSPKTAGDQHETKADSTISENYKVTGVGGIFFKSKDPKASKQWYYDQLGLQPNDYGSLFEYREGSNPNQKAYLQWSPFNEKTKYFEPSDHEYMINFRVGDIERLVKELKENGVTVLDTIESYSYGKFVHILDPDSVKVELWQPIDSTFTALYDGTTTK